jgi:hypothetical protein
MNVLRDFISAVLFERALGPNDMPTGSIIEIRSLGEGYVVVTLIDAAGKVVGEVGMHEPDDDTGPCDGAWVIASTHAQKGWGPLLYDIAIEWATLNGSGLTPDRESVSKEAFNIWDRYMKTRPDVKHTQLSLDACSHFAAAKLAGFSDANPNSIDDKKKLEASPLSKYYSKPPKMIGLLRKAGLIRIKQ